MKGNVRMKKEEKLTLETFETLTKSFFNQQVTIEELLRFNLCLHKEKIETLQNRIKNIQEILDGEGDEGNKITQLREILSHGK